MTFVSIRGKLRQVPRWVGIAAYPLSFLSALFLFDTFVVGTISLCKPPTVIVKARGAASIEEAVFSVVVRSEETILWRYNGKNYWDPYVHCLPVRPEHEGGVLVMTGRVPGGQTFRHEFPGLHSYSSLVIVLDDERPITLTLPSSWRDDFPNIRLWGIEYSNQGFCRM